ncbi:MAG: site-specific DNA-methyltransferase [bacterium]|nr:site-specific DNA-methyltransferase [bacterium]
MKRFPLPRLDTAEKSIRANFLPYCRLKPGEYWSDPEKKHLVGCGDATNSDLTTELYRAGEFAPPTLAVHDPPYNLVMEKKSSVTAFINWCRLWVNSSFELLADNAALYIWMGADQNDHFQPLGQFLQMMAESQFDSRSFVTMRNQRGYGTQKNWMAVRQELISYSKGNPKFEVQYTDIPRLLSGYFKEVAGARTENGERSRSETIRPGNVWVDIQQVFYRMEENVSGCYAQKPLKAIERIVESSSVMGETVLDFFSHSGTTLLACERLGRRCLTLDLDPIFAEITIRRLENYRNNGKLGWQASNPFQQELEAVESKALLSATVER